MCHVARGTGRGVAQTGAMTPDPVVLQHAEDALRAQGVRVTKPRREVLALLAAVADLPTADEMLERLDPAAGATRATLYRTLQVGVEVGVVCHVHTGHTPTRYHLSAPDAEDHVHLFCVECQRLVTAPRSLLGGAEEQLGREGFLLDPSHLALSGRCRRCAAGS